MEALVGVAVLVVLLALAVLGFTALQRHTERSREREAAVAPPGSRVARRAAHRRSA